MIATALQLASGGLLLYVGAEWLVGGACALALALRLPQVVVGLTVVAYGTSAPEVVVGVEAAGEGHGGVALGNVIGSNIANIGLILGVSALVRPARVDPSLARRELPVLVATALVVPALLLDGEVSRFEGACLLLGAIAYTAWMVRSVRRTGMVEVTPALVAEERAAEAAGAPSTRGHGVAAVTMLLGLAVVSLGGHVLVDGAISAARALGVSDRLVGLKVVAVGTSLPELVTGVVAALRGHADIAVGNVIGSNIFNVLLCLGTAAIAAPVAASVTSVAPQLAVLVGLSATTALLVRSARTISRAEGAILLASYVGFVALTIVER